MSFASSSATFTSPRGPGHSGFLNHPASRPGLFDPELSPDIKFGCSGSQLEHLDYTRVYLRYMTTSAHLTTRSYRRTKVKAQSNEEKYEKDRGEKGQQRRRADRTGRGD